MPILNSIAAWLMKKRIHQIELFMKYPNDVQEEWLSKLLKNGASTEFGKKHGFASITNYEQFKKQVPLQDYESLKPYIERIRRGEQYLLWNEEVKWFAKSSGTTSDKSKFIPVSPESLNGCHYNGGRDMVAIHCVNTPETNLFTGKNLALGGSHQTDYFGDYESYHGDVSAIVIQNLPMWAEYFRAPDLNIALMSNWEDKLKQMVNTTMNANVTSMAGVPSWMLVLLKEILKEKKVSTMKEVWPNLEVYFHGGVSFTPYSEQFKRLLDNESISYLELYNASEGFFGIQDQRNVKELLLMLDYGIYYEFIPVEDVDKENPRVYNLAEVNTETVYSMVISTTAGLWRYQLGDTITFTETSPYRFVIAGRTKHNINVFGEELMIHNAEKALHMACEKTHAHIVDYTAAPVFMGEENGAHEWLIEFDKEPNNLEYFIDVLDKSLKQLNSDYEAKRFNNYILKMPIVRSLPKGTFIAWMKSKNKLGAQNKVPRLSNERLYVEEIKALIDC
ncbi:MAG: GH3 auxin-responsive promoter family protein [Bacteroidota bacterium]|nr:GH3 auxin-responsive promoter family protein [Bacteroidota bacterium]